MTTEMDQNPVWSQIGNYKVTNELFLDLVFNNECNAGCPFCIAKTKSYCKYELEKWKETVKETFEKFDIRNIIILGGEATIDRYFFEKVEYVSEIIKDKNVDNVILTTNGIKLRDQEFLERLLKTRINSINLSYMNYNKEINDSIYKNNTLTKEELKHVYDSLKKVGKTMRLNVNVYKGNIDTVEEMENFAKYFLGCYDAIKFSPLMPTDMFDTIDRIVDYTNKVSLNENEVNTLYDTLCTRNKIVKKAKNVLGFCDYAEIKIDNGTVILKYAQVEDKYDRDNEIPTLKIYPNGNLANEWNYKKDILKELRNI